MMAREKDRTREGLSSLGWVEISDGEPKKAFLRRWPLSKGLKEIRPEPSSSLGECVLAYQTANALSQACACSVENRREMDSQDSGAVTPERCKQSPGSLWSSRCRRDDGHGRQVLSALALLSCLTLQITEWAPQFQF